MKTVSDSRERGRECSKSNRDFFFEQIPANEWWQFSSTFITPTNYFLMDEFISITLHDIGVCWSLFFRCVEEFSHGIKSFNFLNKYLSWAKHFSYGSVNQLLSPIVHLWENLQHTHAHTLSRLFASEIGIFLCMIFEHDTDSLTSIKECPWEIVNGRFSMREIEKFLYLWSVSEEIRQLSVDFFNLQKN